MDYDVILVKMLALGRHLWLCLALALGLALGTQAALAKECHHETLLPADIRLIAPDPEVPEAVARFAGAWSGVSVGPGDRTPICETLVVEGVYTNGYARVIFSVGTSAALDVRQPGFGRATGRIVDGELRVLLPFPYLLKLTYRVVGETLQGTSSVGCRRHGAGGGGHPPLPLSSGLWGGAAAVTPAAHGE